MSPPRQQAVQVPIRRADGRWLLVRRAAGLPAAGFWVPVGGRPHPGETLVEAARREAGEEVGLAVEIAPEPVFRCDAVGAPWELVWFLARPADPQAALRPLTLQAAEVAEARWLTVAEIAALEPMFDATRRFFTSRGASAR